MNASYDYIQFINEKIMEYLPPDKIKIGDKINFRCPICGDSHKSLSKKRGFYYLKTASFYCFNCSTGMTGVKFLQILSGKEYADIKKEYAKEFVKNGIWKQCINDKEEQIKNNIDFMNIKSMLDSSLKMPLTSDAKKYLSNRMIDKAPFLREDLFSYKGSKGDYILIPWVVNGIDAYYQLNDYKKHGSLKYIFPKNSNKLVYGLDNIDLNWPYIIVFEGVYDSLFVKNAIAVGTKSLSDRQEKIIKERYPNHKICLSFDNDKPGIDSMAKIIEKNEDVLFFRWFDNDTTEKDINEKILAVNDVKLFSKPSLLEKRIMTPLQMKIWLVQSKGYSFGLKKFKAKNQRLLKSNNNSLLSRRSLFE